MINHYYYYFFPLIVKHMFFILQHEENLSILSKIVSYRAKRSLRSQRSYNIPSIEKLSTLHISCFFHFQVKDIISRYRLNSERETAEEVLMKLHKSVKVVVSLVNMCKAHDKVLVTHTCKHLQSSHHVDILNNIFLAPFDGNVIGILSDYRCKPIS